MLPDDDIESTATIERAIPRLLESLRETCRPETLSRGRSYEEQGRVRKLEFLDARAKAEVIGTDEAPYEVGLDLKASPARSSCTCPAWGSWDDHCKHVAALAFALEKAVRGERVRTFWPSLASRVQLVCNLGMPSSSTKHMRQAASGLHAQSIAHRCGISMPARAAAESTVSPAVN